MRLGWGAKPLENEQPCGGAGGEPHTKNRPTMRPGRENSAAHRASEQPRCGVRATRKGGAHNNKRRGTNQPLRNKQPCVRAGSEPHTKDQPTKGSDREISATHRASK
ncbi:hypothetical protein V6N11_046125 [Hibiscus sabdariffa]|uniref:Uncharacterized protein n=1 Tax=Hibiscus sabdariffa TaxID=183260 RepID=A0ABR2A3J9_9ROSI